MKKMGHVTTTGVVVVIHVSRRVCVLLNSDVGYIDTIPPTSDGCPWARIQFSSTIRAMD